MILVLCHGIVAKFTNVASYMRKESGYEIPLNSTNAITKGFKN